MNMSRIITILACLVTGAVVLVSVPSLAATTASDMMATTVPDAQTAAVFVKDLADTAIKSMVESAIPDEERQRRFRELFTRSFDLPAIGQFVLGRYWRKATEQEKAEFTSLFENISVLTWSSRFKDYNGQTLTVDTVHPADNGELVVETSISQPQGQKPVAVSWRLHPAASGFKVVDLTVEDVSMALTYRSEYGTVIQHANGKVEGLLEALRHKLADLRTLRDTTVAHGVTK
ncbi:MAG: ABC transporter substrate-binding protein [Alphaproteobacteria bacterium]|nr:ABC transporter substrate-binding protein [Alphaproteobacteria bacterium]